MTFSLHERFRKLTRFLALLVLLLAAALSAQDAQFRELVDKERRGALTDEERETLRSTALRLREPYLQQNPPRESTGLIPLPDLRAESYLGEQGGLYPGGANTPPPAHLQAGMKIAERIVPLNQSGRDPGPNHTTTADARIVFLALGMSNTSLEFQTFRRLAYADPDRNPLVAFVNGAQGGQTVDRMIAPEGGYWKEVDARLRDGDYTREQVQIAWLKNTLAGPQPAFPSSSRRLQELLVKTLQVMSERFSNLKIVYLSSRIYGGYAMGPLNPEPWSYESGFAVKWAIADQIAGKPELNFDASVGVVRAPWIAWGPYLWADGLRGRLGDGLVWRREDLTIDDGTHPSGKGRERVARLLLEFLKSDPTSRSWFVR